MWPEILLGCFVTHVSQHHLYAGLAIKLKWCVMLWAKPTNQIGDNCSTKKDGSNALVNQQYGTFDTDINKGMDQVDEKNDFKDNEETILKTILSITMGIFFNPTIILSRITIGDF